MVIKVATYCQGMCRENISDLSSDPREEVSAAEPFVINYGGSTAKITYTLVHETSSFK